jgi:hypothetical protein
MRSVPQGQLIRVPYVQFLRPLDPASSFAPYLSIGAKPYGIESSADQGCLIPTTGKFKIQCSLYNCFKSSDLQIENSIWSAFGKKI